MNITQLNKGLYLDSSPESQPKDTYRFALNSVNETELGDFGFIGNEESNEFIFNTKSTPVGKCYISGDEVLIASVDINGDSFLGILKEDTYTEILNDIGSINKLNFNINRPIKIIYRLRRGCERTFYFAGDDNPPRLINIDSLEDYNTDGVFDADKINLFKRYNSIPKFDTIKIVQGGELPSGSYNITIQYLDEDLNPTEHILSTDTIIIYNDKNKSFEETRGSTNVKTDARDFGLTSKAIQINLSNLDTNYPYYRLGIISANNGSGDISEIYATEEISIQKNTYTIVSLDKYSKITLEEILIAPISIEKVGTLEQIENRLILGNVEGKQINFCNLQKYASKIKADCILSDKVVLNNLDEYGNPKRGEHHIELTGYQPGEIYSFGIVWIFEDNTLSPVNHIPGKSFLTENQIFDLEYDDEGFQLTYPMSIDNTIQNTYIDNSCDSSNFWGYDSQGFGLKDNPIRHHRFPLRSELNIPLVEEANISEINLLQNNLKLTVEGTSQPDIFNQYIVSITIQYTEDGVTKYVNRNIPIEYDNTVNTTVDVATSTGTLTYVSTTILTYPNTSSLTFTESITTTSYTGYNKIYTSRLLGIKFSGIEIPSLEDTNGNKVIGYYIVRNKREDSNKTILDNAILLPTQKEEYYVAYAHSFITEDADFVPQIQKDVLAIVNPEFLFNGKEYTNPTKIIQEGIFTYSNERIYNSLVQDVMPGTSYDASINKRRERDNDGFTLHTLTKYREHKYNPTNTILAQNSEIKDTFYLNSLFSKKIIDINANNKEIFNVSEDNKIGIVQLNKEYNYNTNNIPYVVLKQDKENVYSNFQILPYYLDSKQVENFSSCKIFSGDSYISPMTYTSSTFYDIRLRKRSNKSGVWRAIVGVLAIIAGVLMIIGTLGGGTAAGIMVIGWGINQVSTGIKIEQMSKVYNELYDAGLKDCINDAATLDNSNGFNKNPSDDEVQWFSNQLQGLWFESSININWRMGLTNGISDFENPLLIHNHNRINDRIVDKLTTIDTEADGGRLYQGFCNAEIYNINKDYQRRNQEKIFYALGVEYDCCSKCTETFPHRVHYSEQSFQEELSDNYRVFLPNNYRDIEGETGQITEIFRLNNDLFIHTEEALWQLPRNYQERVTDQIISFVGTGSYFEVPPRKLIDDSTGNSAGTTQKLSHKKTPYGILFVSDRENKIYLFDGQKLNPISNIGMYKYFKDNIKLKDIFINSPMATYGKGFITTYDTLKERLIVTKKDFELTEVIDNYSLCGNTIVIEDPVIIEQYLQNEYTYLGIEDCKMKFMKQQEVVEQQTINQVTTISNDAYVVFWLDTSASFTQVARNTIVNSINSWYHSYINSNLLWEGSIWAQNNPGEPITNNPYVIIIGDTENLVETERWLYGLQYIKQNYFNGSLNNKNIVYISFVNESYPSYHSGSLNNTITPAETDWEPDLLQFIINYNECKSFNGLLYPVVSGENISGYSRMKVFMQSALAALKGRLYTESEFNLLIPNPNIVDWNTTMHDSLITNGGNSNPYQNLILTNGILSIGINESTEGLSVAGWNIITNRTWTGSGEVISAVDLTLDITQFLQGITTIEEITQEIITHQNIYEYVSCQSILPTKLDKSWTLSFSLRNNSWISWHSYLPTFYIDIKDKFYSFNGSNYYKHNIPNNYQVFYDELKDFIIEYVSLSDVVKTKIWDTIRLNTIAKEYDENTQSTYDIDETFNKMIVYNSKQCSGEITLQQKNLDSDYLLQQITDTNTNIALIDRTERDWFINDFRDIRIKYNTPIWKNNLTDIQDNYFIDKVLNEESLNIEKNWYDLQNFIDKFLVVRFIFNTFANKKLIINISVEDEQDSIH